MIALFVLFYSVFLFISLFCSLFLFGCLCGLGFCFFSLCLFLAFNLDYFKVVIALKEIIIVEILRLFFVCELLNGKLNCRNNSCNANNTADNL